MNDEAIPRETKRSVFEKLSTIEIENRPIWHKFMGKWSHLHDTSPPPEVVPEEKPEPSA